MAGGGKKETCWVVKFVYDSVVLAMSKGWLTFKSYFLVLFVLWFSSSSRLSSQFSSIMEGNTMLFSLYHIEVKPFKK